MTVSLCHCVERRTCCNNELRMSGISRSFKVPSFIKSKKRKISHSLPTFNWENVSNLKELGIGSTFGVVYSANYVGATDMYCRARSYRLYIRVVYFRHFST